MIDYQNVTPRYLLYVGDQNAKQTWYVIGAVALMSAPDMTYQQCVMHEHPIAAMQEMRRRERLEQE